MKDPTNLSIRSNKLALLLDNALWVKLGSDCNKTQLISSYGLCFAAVLSLMLLLGKANTVRVWCTL